MNRFSVPASMLVMLFLGLLLGCSSNGNPVTGSVNAVDTQLTRNPVSSAASTHLWGFYTVTIDPVSGTVEAVTNRTAEFTANVTNFINSNPYSMSFGINEIVIGTGYTDVDIDVALTHPFPGLPDYNGYDVRGIFMGNGSGTLQTTGVEYPVKGTDQAMFADPNGGNGAPDGYTRWYNSSEFSESSMPLFSYTPGKLATPGFDGKATLCPYKYFADSLGTDENLFSFLDGNANLHGVFSSGATNERNYHLRFPDSTGVTYGYAIIANWAGTLEEFHPANAEEAVACDVIDNSQVYYVDPSVNGGILDLDISVFDWHSAVSAGQMDDYDIFIESTVTSAPYQLSDTEMIPVGGNENYSTYHVEIDADNVIGPDDNEYWVIVQYPDYTYANDMGQPNLVENELLTSYFRFPLNVSSDGNVPPECDLVAVTEFPMEGWDVGVPVEFDASGSTDPDGDPLTFEWDFDGDGIFGDEYDGDDFNPTHWYTESYTGEVAVRVSDGNGGISECGIQVEVIAYPSKNLELRVGEIPYDLAADPVDGDLLVLYADGEIWKRTVGSFYQPDTDIYFGSLSEDAMQDPTGLRWMDIAGNSAVSICGVTDNEGFNRQVFYLADGSPGGCGIFIGSSSNLFDAFALTDDAGVSSNNAGAAKGLDAYWSNSYQQELEWHDDPAYCTVHRSTNSLPYTTDPHGPNVIYYPYCVAVESAKSGPYCWWLEDTDDYYASKWDTSGTQIFNTLSYANQYFGTGTQTEADTCWYEAQDLSRDINDNYFVLDKLSDGSGRMKVFSTGNPGTSLGGLDVPDEISSDPLRIEGSDFDQETYGGYVFVMHGNSTDGYYISVFLEMETPQ